MEVQSRPFLAEADTGTNGTAFEKHRGRSPASLLITSLFSRARSERGRFARELDRDTVAFIFQDPLVLSVRYPWNFPILMGRLEAGPALAAGWHCFETSRTDASITFLVMMELVGQFATFRRAERCKRFWP